MPCAIPDLLLLRLNVESAGLLLMAGFEPAHRGFRNFYNPIARSPIIRLTKIARAAGGTRRPRSLSTSTPKTPTIALTGVGIQGGFIVSAYSGAVPKSDVSERFERWTR